MNRPRFQHSTGPFLANNMRIRNCIAIVALLLVLTMLQHAVAKDAVLRAGIVGCDTSHVEAFTKLINKPGSAPAPFDAIEVVAAFPGGSPDIPKESSDRVPGYVKNLTEMGVKIVDSLDELAEQCDVFMLESVDGRPHLKQFRIAKGKPVFVDKPAADSLANLLTIYRIADETDTPVYTSSSLRFGSEVQAAAKAAKEKSKDFGDLLGCETESPMTIEKHHPDLFWYGIHGVEPLYTIMGTGCVSISRTDSPLSSVVVGKWNDGRIGSYRGLRTGHYYSFAAYGTKKVIQSNRFEGYEPAVVAMCEFFKTGKPPVPRNESVEIYAFMEAADASKKAGGKPVLLADTIEQAKQIAAAASSREKNND